MNMTTQRFILLIFIVSMTFSCTNNQTNNTLEAQTPEVLQDNKSELDISRLGKYSYRGQDIVKLLFDEAVNKDPQLNKLVNNIDRLREQNTDSLASFKQYMGNNEEYWTTLQNYITQISDTSLSKELSDFFKVKEINYNNSIATLTAKETEIGNKEQKLQDMEIVMKLLVTSPMMMNYQKNELPDINTLKLIIADYEKVMKEVEPYTNSKKPIE